MSISFTIRAGQGAASPSAANVVARLGVCANADAASTIYQFDGGQDVLPALAAGPLAVDAASASTWGGSAQIAVKVPATTAGTISAVTKPGGDTSPTPTVAGSAFDGVANSPFDAFAVKLRYSGGLPGATSVEVALDGASYAYTYHPGPQLPATLVGAVITPTVLGSLLAKTLVFVLPSVQTITFAAGSLVAAAAGLFDPVVSVAAPVTVAAAAMKSAGKAALLAHPRRIRITTGGSTQTDAPPTAVVNGHDFAGVVLAETVTINQGTGSVSTTGVFADVSTVVYAAADGTGATLEIGYEDAYADSAELATAMDALLVSASEACAVTIDETQHLVLATTALGSAVALTLNASPGTAATLLGFTTGETATGTESTLALPGTGLVVTLPSTAPYVAGAVHSFTTTAPQHSKADFDAALAALNADLALDFGLVELVQEPADVASLAAYVADTDATGAAWEAQNAKRFVHFLVPAPSGATDLAVKNVLASEQSRYTTVAARWVYQTAVRGLPSGSFPRSAARPLATRCASVSMSEDPGFAGFGPLSGCSMLGPDGTTRAPDENTAAVKLGTSKGPGYTVIKGKAENGRLLPYFVRGVTRAGQSSLFVDLGVTRMIERAGAVIYASLQKIENLTMDLGPTGKIQEHDAVTYEDTFRLALIAELVPDHASAAVVAIDRTEVISSTRNVTVAYEVQERGQGEWITASLTLVGTLVVDGQTVGG